MIVGFWEIIVDGVTYFADRYAGESMKQAKEEAVITFETKDVIVIKH